MWIVATISGIMIGASLVIMNYAYKSGNYRRCYYITIVVIFMLIFPVFFLLSGGYRGGMPFAFIFAILYTMLMLDGWPAFAMAGIEILIYLNLTWLCYFFPDIVVPFPTEKEFLDDFLFAMVTVGTVCGTALFLHIKEYNLQHQQLEEKNKKLSQMDEAKSVFLNTVAHEVKNPLNIISLHAQDTMELLEETPVDMEQISENQKTIVKTVIRMDRILTDLMDSVSIEQGRLKLSPAPMLLAEVIDEASEPWKKGERSKKNQTVIRLELDRTLPPISADYARIYQVMTNLLNNAFRHTKKGTVTVRLEKKDGYQQVCVADNGEGMTKEIQKDALKGYVSVSKEYWRHGIGLYVCNRIVEAHGGKIQIESEQGKGTSIYFSLPEGVDIE